MGQLLAARRRDTRVALGCAEAFEQAGERFVTRIGDDVKRRTPAPPTNIGRLVVSATNIAFALELYIKTLLAEMQVNVPRGHDLGKLYAEIPRAVRDEIQKSYATFRQAWYGRRASVTIAKGPLTPPRWDDSRGLSNDIEPVLIRSGDVFSSWRYIYEFTEPDQAGYQFHRLEYACLLCACRAIRSAIKDRLHNSAGEAEL